MKRFSLIIIAFLFFIPTVMTSQDRAIGLRFGGGNFFGAEISYQGPFNRDRKELNLGMGSSSDWTYWTLNGLYQWVFPIEQGFNWYVGLGPTIGNLSYRGNDHDISNEIYLALALNGGIEYNFSEVPLRISIDARPELAIVNADSAGMLGLALGVRYRF